MAENVILFFPDSLSQNVLTNGKENGLYLPNIEYLKQTGTSFTSCYAQNPVCTPSRCTLFTGRYVHNDGHRSLSNLLQPHEAHLFSYLKEAGYETDIIGKNDLLSESIVKKYVQQPELNHIKPSSFPQPKYDIADHRYYSFQYQPSDGGVYQRDEHYINLAKQFIERKHEKPYFLFIPIHLPHPGYFSNLKWKDSIKKEDIQSIKPEIKNKPQFHKLIRDSRFLDKLDESEFKEIKATYYNMCLQVDEFLGQILDAVGEDTTIIFSSDHGDYQGNYKLVEKWPTSAEDDIVNVPLIMRGKDIPERKEIHTPVQLIDLMETILDITGVTSTEVNYSQSLVPLIKGETSLHREYVFCEGGYDSQDYHLFEGNKMPDKTSMYYPKAHVQQTVKESASRFVMVRDSRYKYVYRTNQENELYDMQADPDELQNLYHFNEFKDIIHRFEKAMLEWFVKTSDTTPLKTDKRGW